MQNSRIFTSKTAFSQQNFQPELPVGRNAALIRNIGEGHVQSQEKFPFAFACRRLGSRLICLGRKSIRNQSSINDSVFLSERACVPRGRSGRTSLSAVASVQRV